MPLLWTLTLTFGFRLQTLTYKMKKMKNILFAFLMLFAFAGQAQNLIVKSTTFTPQGSAPAISEGKVYYDDTTKKFYGRTNAGWVDLQAGTGSVSISGTPVTDQLTYWTNANTIAGDAGLTYNPATDALTAGSVTGALTMNATSALNTGITLNLNGETNVTTGSTDHFKFIPTDTQNAGPEEGMLYADDTANGLMYYDGTAWVDLTAGDDFSLSEADQTIATATNRIVNTAGSGDITFQQTGTPLLRIGNNNDNAIYIESIEALTGNTVGSVSPLASKILDAQTDLATDYDYATIYDSGDGDAYFSDGTNWRQITPPFFDGTAVVKGSVDATKLVRIEADSLTTGTTRVIHMRDADVDLNALTTDNIASGTIKPADLNVINTLTDTQVFTYDSATGNFEMAASTTPSDVAYAVSWNANTDAATKNAIYDEMEQRVPSKTAGEPTGSDVVTNMVSLTQAELDAGTPVAGTAYIVTDAKTTHEERIPFTALGADLVVGTKQNTFMFTQAVTITDIYASVDTAPTGSGIVIDVNKNGTTIMTTDKLDIDVSERSTLTAATAPALTTTAFAAGDWLSIDTDSVGSTTAGTTGHVYIRYTED